MLDVAIIGGGNVAWHLLPALENGGHTVRWLWARNPKQARALQKRSYQAEVLSALSQLAEVPAEVVLLCVSDEAIAAVASELQLGPGTVVVHCSGATPLSALDPHPDQAVMWPVQTFKQANEPDWGQIPLVTTASGDRAKRTVKALAKSLGGPRQEVDEATRARLHLAATLTANLSNQLFAEADELLAKSKVPFSFLAPLLLQQVKNAADLGPANAQTGPAVRGDLAVLDQHMDLLLQEGKEDLAEVYKLLSQLIINQRG